MAKHANGVSKERDLGIQFQAFVPRMMVLGTGTGDSGAYPGTMGITPKQFVARFGLPMPPMAYGDRVISVLEDPKFADGMVFGLFVESVKAHPARGRASLLMMNAQAAQQFDARPASDAITRFAALFRQRDWDGLRALLADDVKLQQSTHLLRIGATDVGIFVSVYAKLNGLVLVPALLEGREAVAAFECRSDSKPSYVMWLEWRDGIIIFFRDYRHVRYAIASGELTLAQDASDQLELSLLCLHASEK